MNYIKHLNAILDQFSKDRRLNTTHISLYLALFYIWNYNRFPKDFFINREEVMSQSKIGSKSTYHKCIKELSNWKYILYSPSHNPFKGSRVQLFQFGTSEIQGVDLDRPINGQASVSYININKHNTNINKPLSIKEIFNFFKKKNWSENEAEKFFNYYESVGWKKGNNPIENWQAAAESWMLKTSDFKVYQKSKKKATQNDPNALPLDHFYDNLHVNENKRYDEPL
ncbi:hypothetical protein SAMN06265371_10839 [Lutibacter agarilyticus]|uniref:Uncharacterized protein n=1 Tax=Lutibacter agarilyticus TaxID=1109740 RepID=A0A238Y5C4_9FLAO|nr:hypothetical protein [Lutibacter agarilyticus]SNR66220.1 hypothetical protein SAMN06265371_10839 [Lutibacter agarilyticus]